MWPRRIEPGPSCYPRRLRGLAALVTWLALALSGLPASLVGLVGLIACAGLARWRPPMPRAISVRPEALSVTLPDHRVVTVEAPFRALLRPGWLALHCPGEGWVWLFPDQASAAALTPLRQVLWLRSRP